MKTYIVTYKDWSTKVEAETRDKVYTLSHRINEKGEGGQYVW